MWWSGSRGERGEGEAATTLEFSATLHNWEVAIARASFDSFFLLLQTGNSFGKHTPTAKKQEKQLQRNKQKEKETQQNCKETNKTKQKQKRRNAQEGLAGLTLIREH
jgi:hypothetical protein